MEPSAATVQYKHAAMSSGVSIQLLMLGKDNPNGSTGIVFCRQTWAEQTHRTCPGRYVLEALGVDWRIESERSAAPMELFYKLMRAGVVFLSPCYAPATGKPLDRLTYRIALDVGDVFNREIVNAASVVIRCGEATLMERVKPAISPKCRDEVHPDIRNSFNRWTKERWAAAWGTPCSLAWAWPVKPNDIQLR